MFYEMCVKVFIRINPYCKNDLTILFLNSPLNTSLRRMYYLHIFSKQKSYFYRKPYVKYKQNDILP